MGGEWEFHFEDKPDEGSASEFDIQKYQNLLAGLREKWSGKLKSLSTHQLEENPWTVSWFEENPDDNIFAKFEYECSRHKGWGTDGHKPVWYLLWDPRVENAPRNKIHARCADLDFVMFSERIHRELCNAFPSNFWFYYGDGRSGYGEREYWWPPHRGVQELARRDAQFHARKQLHSDPKPLQQ